MEKLENKSCKEGELEKCVSCGEITGIKKEIHIDMRKGYIEGAGQLCDNCYRGIYRNGGIYRK